MTSHGDLIEAVRLTAAQHPTFTADDIWTNTRDPYLAERRGLGAAIRFALKVHWIRPTGTYRRSKLRRGVIPVWRSELCREVESCLYCGASLAGMRPSAKFCTPSHRALYHQRNAKGTVPPHDPPLTPQKP